MYYIKKLNSNGFECLCDKADTDTSTLKFKMAAEVDKMIKKPAVESTKSVPQHSRHSASQHLKNQSSFNGADICNCLFVKTPQSVLSVWKDANIGICRDVCINSLISKELTSNESLAEDLKILPEAETTIVPSSQIYKLPATACSIRSPSSTVLKPRQGNTVSNVRLPSRMRSSYLNRTGANDGKMQTSSAGALRIGVRIPQTEIRSAGYKREYFDDTLSQTSTKPQYDIPSTQEVDYGNALKKFYEEMGFPNFKPTVGLELNYEPIKLPASYQSLPMAFKESFIPY
jgi:hypothetical protein